MTRKSKVVLKNTFLLKRTYVKTLKIKIITYFCIITEYNMI
jgi:hypothetical protein